MEKWVRLENFRCPVTDCEGGSTPSTWYCYNDSTGIYLSQKGNMRCNQSSGSSWAHHGLIVTWRFDCGNHGDHPFSRFREADFEGFTFALSSAVQLMGKAGGRWVGQLCEELGRQYGQE